MRRGNPKREQSFVLKMHPHAKIFITRRAATRRELRNLLCQVSLCDPNFCVARNRIMLCDVVEIERLVHGVANGLCRQCIDNVSDARRNAKKFYFNQVTSFNSPVALAKIPVEDIVFDHPTAVLLRIRP
ncbi:hypothetical protein EVAR_44877_1 [Eumeta japonica]|uniref:Uncharacterized protein n=1 Tax=Eumeta variegata TaxID=151549 RepID=A0A4C1Y5P7_EUMVA|nr:hypothetical protein EVAR_44877_1 [Eumeta japonica]